MHVKLGSALLLLMLSTSSALAQTNDWATCTSAPTACTATKVTCCKETGTNLGVGASTNKPIIIPMDRCHQTIANNDYPGPLGPSTGSNGGWCVDNAATNASGMFHAYGLIYRMMQRGVPVYWIVNPTKTAPPNNQWDSGGSAQRYTNKDIDMWLLSSGATIPSITTPFPATGTALTACSTGCTPPVSLLKTVSGSLVTDSTWTYSKQEFPLRGSAFLISSTDRPAFNTFWNAYGDGNPGAGRVCGQTTDCYDFTNVRLYEINTGTTAAWRDHLTSTNNTDSVPLAVKITYQPPRIARVESGGAVSQGWLKAANLNDQACPGATGCTTNYPTADCASGAFYPSDAVWCEMTEAQVNNNGLVAGNFAWAWMDGGSGFSSCSKVLKKMRTFLQTVPGLWNAGNVMANDTKLSEIEQCVNYQLLGQAGATANSLTTGGTAVNEKKTGSTYQPLLIRYPTNLFMQYGDFLVDFASSSVAWWSTNGTHKYSTRYTGTSNTLKRLISREDVGTATNRACADANLNNDLGDVGELAHSWDTYPQANVSGCDQAPSASAGDKEDMMSYGRLDNSALDGIIFYTAGNQISNKTAELRMVLNSLLAVPSGGVTLTGTLTETEVARSTPVVPQLDTGSGAFDAVVQGTSVYVTDASGNAGSPKMVLSDADAATFEYPYRMGHMRARRASDSSVVFDAGCNATVGGNFACATGTAGIPSTTNTYTGSCTFPKSSSNADCRTIFTTTASGDLRAASTVYFDQNLNATGKALISQGVTLSATSVNTIIQRVIAGFDISGTKYPRLGAVGRSTPAIIPPSNLAGDLSRPMMAYFGAEDGMLHAVCAEVNATKGCDKLGRELWAYIPRTALPFLRLNQAHIGGSPRVIDAKIDYDGSGSATAAWRTVLMFQTGFGDSTADGRQSAVYALDISDPRSPKVLWEYSMNVATRGTDEMGLGLGLAAGPVVNGTTTEYWAWAQTTNGGTNSLTSTVLTAINVETGVAQYKKPYTYAASSRVGSNDPVVTTALPGGAVVVDLTDSGTVSDLTFTDLYGSLWMVNPLTGVSRTGANKALFTLATDYHSIGASPAIMKVGSAQYAVFTTGGYADQSNTSWPLECCKSSNGTSCDVTQPTSPVTCAQYNNSTFVKPLDFAVAVKLDATQTNTQTAPTTECDADSATTTISACTAPLYFKKNLGADERGYVSPLIIGTQIFYTTDTQNVNRFSYVGGTGVGKLSVLNSNTGTTTATVALTTGATGLGISNNPTGAKTIYGSTNAGSFFTSTHDGSTGPAVEKAQSAGSGASRKAWLRLE